MYNFGNVYRNRITITDLRRFVEKLNEEYHFDKINSDCYFDILSAYGGYQIVLKPNRKYGSWMCEISSGYTSARETIDYVKERLNKYGYEWLDDKVQYIMSRYNHINRY